MPRKTPRRSTGCWPASRTVERGSPCAAPPHWGTLVLYDVSSSYVEGAAPWPKRGYNRDGKKSYRSSTACSVQPMAVR